MERPKLRYAYNEALINTYAEELEKYCDYLENSNKELCKDLKNLNEVLDKAYDFLIHLNVQDVMNNRIVVNNMNKDKLLEYLEIMCKRCTNHEICQGTGCTPKKEIEKYIDEKGQ